MSGARVPISALLNQPQQDTRPYFARTQLVNDREYYEWSRVVYPYPCDDREQDRIDALNVTIYEKALRRNCSIDLPSGVARPRILDVACGTGWWAQRVAEEHDHCEVVGFDLACYQPTGVGLDGRPRNAANVEFYAPLDFTSAHWPGAPSSFHMVHGAMLCGSVADWLDMYRKMYHYLLPGGVAELIEIDWQPRCAVSNPRANDAESFRTWWENMAMATRQQGKSIEYREDTGDLLHQAGFMDVREAQTLIVPCSALGALGGPSTIGRDLWRRACDTEMFRLGMGEMTIKPWSGMSMELFTRYQGWTRAQVELLGNNLVDAVNRPRSPFYFTLHVWNAKKPE